MKKFTDIESFKHIVKAVRIRHRYNHDNDNFPTISFTGTVKLHGTNVGVRRYFDHSTNRFSYEAQGRNDPLTIKDDNYGFAKFVSEIPIKYWDSLFNTIDRWNNYDPTKVVITIFGEWIGKGIQKKVAVSKLDPKQFVIFDIHVLYDNNSGNYLTNEKFFQFPIMTYPVYNILNADTYEIEIDFNNPEIAAEKLTELTLNVDVKCPWGKLFDIEAPGEGIVWRPDNGKDTNLYFKTKGSSHKVTKENKLIPVDPELVANIEQCVDVILTNVRLEQGWTELFTKVAVEPDIKHIGNYLKWVGQDCKKEEMITIVANNLTWREVSKEIMRRAKEYFLRELPEF